MRTALVTGAAHGIGAATVEHLVVNGWRAIAFDLDATAVDALAFRLGRRCVPAFGDVAEPADWERALAHVRGGLDTLVLNAAAQVERPLAELEPDQWERQLAVTLTGAYHGVRACLPLLAGEAPGIVVVASTQALIGLPGFPAYAAAKGGLLSLTRQLAKELGPAIRVNAVSPGPIRTRVWDESDADEIRQVADATALGRLGEPSEVARAIAFLASPDASFVTGANLVVDGGWSVTRDR